MSSSNAITAQKQKFSVAITTPAYQQLISRTLQDPDRARRFTASITSAVAVNPSLQECTPATILAGALLGESLNLTPSPQLGQYYLVPFKCQAKDASGNKIYMTDANGNKLKDEDGRWIPVAENRAQFVLGYKGYLQLAIRSGQYQDIDVMEIREGEYLGKDPGSGKPRFRFIEDDDAREKLPVIGYMAYFEYLNGFRKVLYWSKEKMMHHADTYSTAFSAEAYRRIQEGQVADKDMWKYSSFWYKNFDSMAKKTLLRQLISRWGIMSIEMQQGFVNDSGIIQVDGNGEFVSVAEEPAEGLQPQPEPVVNEPARQVNLADL